MAPLVGFCEECGGGGAISVPVQKSEFSVRETVSHCAKSSDLGDFRVAYEPRDGEPTPFFSGTQNLLGNQVKPDSKNVEFRMFWFGKGDGRGYPFVGFCEECGGGGAISVPAQHAEIARPPFFTILGNFQFSRSHFYTRRSRRRSVFP